MDRIEKMRDAGREHARLRTANATLAAENRTLEQVIRDTRAGLEPVPVKGEAYRAAANYTTGDEVTLNGVTYVATAYNKGKSPTESPELWTVKVGKTKVLVWADIASNAAIAVGDLVEHNGTTWRCIKAHAKGQVRVPLVGSQWWEVA